MAWPRSPPTAAGWSRSPSSSRTRACSATPVTVATFYDRLTPQSAQTLAEPFRVELPATLDKTFVFASAERSPQFRPYAVAARRDPSWRYIEVPATHWLMFSHPREVAAIILDPDLS